MKRIAQRVLMALAVAWAAGLLTLVACAALLVGALRAAPGTWAVPVTVGPWHFSLSVPAMLRMATHPLGLRLLVGHTLATPAGTLTLLPGTNESSLRIVCDPCTLRIAALGPKPLPLVRTELTLIRIGQNDLHGELRAGNVRATWRAELQSQGAHLALHVPDAPIADFYALFSAVVPELAQAQIEGRAGGELRLSMPEMAWSVMPRIDAFSVSGLNTERLLSATPALACAKPTRAADAAAPFGVWLPRAVVSAEDQRFFEHTGFDLVEMQSAWASGTPRGASSLSQQLAKLVFTGDERSVARKLRELLYAVELDRTLGKARVLQLYLAMAPWGEGRCGAQAASLHWLHKRAAELTPIEAAWLASLLRNPDAVLLRMASTGLVDQARVAVILEGMRPVALGRRQLWIEQLGAWAPPQVLARRRLSPLNL